MKGWRNGANETASDLFVILKVEMHQSDINIFIGPNTEKKFYIRYQ